MSIDQMYITTYFVVALVAFNRDVLMASLAVILCCMFSNSSLFDIATSIQVHLSYSIFYFLFVFHIKSGLTKSTLILMGLFNLLMAWDCYTNAKTETWLYLNYVTNTTLIHALIIAALVFRRKNITIYNSIADNLRAMFSDTVNHKYSGWLCGDKTIQRNKARAEQ